MESGPVARTEVSMGVHATLFDIMVVYIGKLIPEIRGKMPAFVALHEHIQDVLTTPDASRITEADFPDILDASDRYMDMLREFRAAGVPEEVINVFVECVKRPVLR